MNLEKQRVDSVLDVYIDLLIKHKQTLDYVAFLEGLLAERDEDR